MRYNPNRTPEWNVKTEIRDYMRKTGWLIIPIPAGKYSVAGAPDYIAFKNGKTVCVEAKSEKGKQSEGQIKMQAALAEQKIPYILAKSAREVHDAIASLGLTDPGLFG